MQVFAIMEINIIVFIDISVVVEHVEINFDCNKDLYHLIGNGPVRHFMPDGSLKISKHCSFDSKYNYQRQV